MNNKGMGTIEILLIAVIVAGVLILCKPIISNAIDQQFMSDSVAQLTEW